MSELSHTLKQLIDQARRAERERARAIVLAHEHGCTSIDPLCLRVIADQLTRPAVGDDLAPAEPLA